MPAKYRQIATELAARSISACGTRSAAPGDARPCRRRADRLALTALILDAGKPAFGRADIGHPRNSVPMSKE
jgi:hypothetical protein